MKEFRRYIRISTVLPVEFYILDKQDKKITPWLQGFTRNIGKGGICLEVKDLWWGFWDRINEEGISLKIRIDYPLAKTPLLSRAKISWRKQIRDKDITTHFLGLQFFSLDKKNSRQLLRYALFKKLVFPFIWGIIILLLSFSYFLYQRSQALIKKNKKLITDYVRTLKEANYLQERLKKEENLKKYLTERKNTLQKEITSLKERLDEFYKKQKELLSQNRKKEMEALKNKISSLEAKLSHLVRENTFLKIKEKEQKAATKIIKEEANSISQQKIFFSRKIIQGMYNWLTNRQNLKTGLVLSYEGDKNLKDVYFTYDETLASIVFLVFGDKERARKILHFFDKQVREKNVLYNAYYSRGGVFEYATHSGPIAWVGIAALNYLKQTQSREFLYLAKWVAQYLIKMMDSEGGIRGGPKDGWYSTEHNLDAFAFFSLLYEVTKKDEYRKVRDKIKGWLKTYTYTQYGPPVKRGKGDSTIATDTYAWSITSIGPEELLNLKMDPDEILKFAIENCAVEVNFSHEKGEIKVQGFDFAPAKNIARGGVVSTEWTAQMILAFEIMADFYSRKGNKEKYKYYLNQAEFYFNELQKMVIISPSKFGRVDPSLPYASRPFVNTGHGWRTPKGTSTGSLAATSYCLLTFLGYNPLKAEFLSFSLKNSYAQRDN